MLNILWVSFFFIAFVAAVGQWIFSGNVEVFAQLVQALFDMGKLSVDIALGLVGVLCLWLGLFRIAEKAGLIQVLAKVLAPLFLRLMPEVPKGHPALGSITMNLSANLLGLDNAATPMGLKAMQDLQTLNPNKDTATNAQILFLVLNTSSVTLLPVTIFMYRAQQGSADPTEVFLPILFATSVSTLVGLLAVCWVQRIKWWDPVILGYFAFFSFFVTGLMMTLSGMDAETLRTQSSLYGNLILISIVVGFIAVACWQKVNVYEAFIEGAKEGFDVAVKLIPYLVAMLVAIGVFRASGAMDYVLRCIAWSVGWVGLDARFVDALPTALMKPLSGSGARAMMLETMDTHGVDSFAARVSAIMQGSTETTFYVLAIYFGSVGIKNMRHAVFCGLLADAAGITAAVLLGYRFFG
ncbi:MAG: spore maturation protein [Pseudomonadales bacterium]|nr:spore maturation protein [Pseudomonadales bacterium]